VVASRLRAARIHAAGMGARTAMFLKVAPHLSAYNRRIASRNLGPYEILASLGAGGMGEVYRARDPRINREVAIKLLPSGWTSDAERLRRFEQETRAAGSINHPNLVTIFDSGSDNGSPYLVMELLDGGTLRDRMDEGIPQRK